MALFSTIWDEVLHRVETKVNAHTYHTWFKSTSLLSDEGVAGLRVQVPSQTVVEWVTRHYADLIAEALVEVGRPGAAVLFVPADGATPQALTPIEFMEPAPEPRAAGEDNTSAPDTVGLSPRYSLTRSLLAPPTSLRTPPVARSLRPRRGRTARSTSTAVWVSAKRT